MGSAGVRIDPLGDWTMKIEGSYRGLNGSVERVYNAMTDPEILRRCIPGCKELRPTGQDEYWCDLAWGYSGTVRAERVSPPFKLNLVVEGKGAAGSVKARGVVHLDAQQEERTSVRYTGDFYLGGPAALLQMGNSLLGGLPYKKLLESFFKSIESELRAGNKS